MALTPKSNQQQQQQQTQAAPEQGASKGFAAFKRSGTYLLSGSGNATLQALAVATRKFIGSDPNNPKLDVVTLDRETNNLHCGAILVSEIRESAMHGKVVVVYTILVESTEAVQLTTTDVTFQNKTYAVPMVLTDAFNQNYWDRVCTAMLSRSQLAGKDSVISAGYGFVTREVYDRFAKGGDAESNELMGIIVTAAEAIGSIGDMSTGVVQRSADRISHLAKGQEARLVRTYSPRLTMSTSGLPVINEAEAAIDFVATGVDRRNMDPINNGGSTMVRVFGYLETILDHDEINRTFGNRTRQSDVSPHIANFVISGMTSQGGLMTISSIAEGMFAALGFNYGHGWVEMLTPRYGADNTRDIGMLMLEAGLLVDNTDEPVDTQSPSFDERMRTEYIGAMYRRDLAMSIDLPEAGDMSWVGDILINASNSTSNPYRTATCQALHDFTDGQFPLDYSGDILINADRRMLIGYDWDQDGNLVDPRTKNDYLALLTRIGRTDLETVRDWDLHSRTEATTGIPENVRLAVTQDIVNRVFGRTGRFVTAVRRYVISRDFLELFAEACNRAGLTPKPSNQSNVNLNNNRRSADVYSNQTLGNGNFFRSSGGGGFGGYNRGSNFTGGF